MIRTFTALAIVAGLAMAPQPAHADRQTGCHKIKINGVEKEFCPGKQGAANATSRPVAPRGIQGGYGATGPIVVGASASMEVTADQITVNVRFTENADDMSGVIQLLKDKREKIGKVAADANLKVTSTQITQLDVRQQRSSQSRGYRGSATFKVSIAGVSDPLEVVGKLSDLDARSVGQMQFSMSPGGLEKATQLLEEMALEDARKQAEQQAVMRGQKVGKLISFDFKANDRRLCSRQLNFTLSGHGRATFAAQ
jgi:uncharacterized protein YggE